jgi:hypothetical protein
MSPVPLTPKTRKEFAARYAAFSYLCFWPQGPVFFSFVLALALSGVATVQGGLAAEYVPVKPASTTSAPGLEKFFQSDASAKLRPKSDNKWELRVKGETQPAAKMDVIIAAPNKPKTPATTYEESWVDFAPKIVNGEKVLEPTVAKQWTKSSDGVERSVKGQEVEALLSKYKVTVAKATATNDPTLYERPSESHNSELAQRTVALRSKLLELAADPASPDSLAAAQTAVSSAPVLELQGSASGMQRVSLQAANALNRAASGVAEVLKDGTRSGVCTKTSPSACLTAAHVVRDVLQYPNRVIVRFHIEGADQKLHSVSVPVQNISSRGWKPKILSRDAGNGLSEEISPSMDYAFLELDLTSLSASDKQLVDKAVVSKVGSNAITSSTISKSLQLFHISYDPNQSTDAGPQLQFRCALLCPAVAYSPADVQVVFEALFSRCLLSNSSTLQTATAANLPVLCGRPIRDEFIKTTLLPQKDNAAISYCAPSVDGVRSLTICYEATTFGGDSGSPVFLYDDSLQGMEQVAIHMAADNSTVVSTFNAKRSAYATPAFLINPEDRQKFCQP